MRLPDVIQDLLRLRQDVEQLQRELEFHHAQFRTSAVALRHLVTLLPSYPGTDHEGYTQWESAVVDLMAKLDMVTHA